MDPSSTPNTEKVHLKYHHPGKVKKVKNGVILANLCLNSNSNSTDRYKTNLLQEYLSENDHFEEIAKKLRKHKTESKWKKNENSHKQDWCKEQMKLIRLEKEQIKYYKSLKKDNIIYDILFNNNNDDGNGNRKQDREERFSKKKRKLLQDMEEDVDYSALLFCSFTMSQQSIDLMSEPEISLSPDSCAYYTERLRDLKSMIQGIKLLNQHDVNKEKNKVHGSDSLCASVDIKSKLNTDKNTRNRKCYNDYKNLQILDFIWFLIQVLLFIIYVKKLWKKKNIKR